jgi:hypothetical protein
MEQDFGFYEGESVFARPQKGSNVSGRDAHRALHKDDPGFIDVESKESMTLRVDTFLVDHLHPIMELDAVDQEHIVAVVSHGIILSVLWRRFLQRLPPKSVTIHPEVVALHGPLDLERFGGWSNTGYLELEMRRLAPPPMSPPLPASVDSVIEGSLSEKETSLTTAPDLVDTVVLSSLLEKKAPHKVALGSLSKSSRTVLSTGVFTAWTTTICAVNHKQHLVGLKRTRGGVGSSRHDEKQKSIHSFFKKQKKE